MNDYTLHFGNAFDLMKNMADGSVDHIITDPPYSEDTHEGARSHTNIDKPFINFDHFSDEEFVTFCTECVRHARRWVIMTCDWQHAHLIKRHPHKPVRKSFIRLGVWVKGRAAPQFTGDRPAPGWEAVLILHRPGRKSWNDGGHHAVWHHNIVHGEHPTQKPLSLVKEWLAQFTDPGETIFDPLMGAGTTGVAATQTQRKFIGIEAERHWFEMAESNIGEAAMQPHLFAIPEATQA